MNKNTENSTRTETFHTTINVPLGFDPVDKFNYDPKRTVGIGVEIIVSYDCNNNPKVDKTKITGFNQVGFIISSEYEVEARVNSSTKSSCTLSGCTNAIQYTFEVKYFIYLLAGIGFGLGGGTGTLGWRSKSRVETKSFTTKCFCCDAPSPAPTVLVPQTTRSGVSIAIGFGILILALWLSSSFFDEMFLGILALSVIGTISIMGLGSIILMLVRRGIFRPSEEVSISKQSE